MPGRRRNRSPLGKSNVQRKPRKSGRWGDPTKIQTLLFGKGWSPSAAQDWAMEHGFKAHKIDQPAEYIRIRQAPPPLFRPETFRTITLTEKYGSPIKAIIGVRKPVDKKKAAEAAKAKAMNRNPRVTPGIDTTRKPTWLKRPKYVVIVTRRDGSQFTVEATSFKDAKTKAQAYRQKYTRAVATYAKDAKQNPRRRNTDPDHLLKRLLHALEFGGGVPQSGAKFNDMVAYLDTDAGTLRRVLTYGEMTGGLKRSGSSWVPRRRNSKRSRSVQAKRDFIEGAWERQGATRRTISDDYGPRRGLEGPFRFKGGRVLYYDPREGAYWDPTTDMYLSKSEDPSRNPRRRNAVSRMKIGQWYLGHFGRDTRGFAYVTGLYKNGNAKAIVVIEEDGYRFRRAAQMSIDRYDMQRYTTITESSVPAKARKKFGDRVTFQTPARRNRQRR